ncbi:hypothetical protein B4072_3771 [Bacillus subtilis]|uniref:Uncharacterized protein n=1 Tax=Bacillus subtilis TaxID=1423 RepID=A0A0C3K7S0_BACIU|nr:hypothetical protein B4069_3722 [Bacillus subtilis]KIN41131.1 hypothetical protein B4072_3771 [Bacillus subtilis]KIN54614.1 hypothetical protein B4146_3965 [Bacillus subtilis]KIU05949.1 hypothetical protein SC09_contig4orf00897 [Bacillus subtilis]KZD86926.1 hypothetical protein B4122_4761 [Bacillus subtilis]
MILLAIQIKYARVKARKEKLPFKTAAFFMQNISIQNVYCDVLRLCVCFGEHAPSYL